MKTIILACLLGFALAMDKAALLEDLFTLVDSDRDGAFSKAEMTDAFDSYDTHKDGRVTEHEFHMVACGRTSDLCHVTKDLFRLFDVNKAHLITSSDLDAIFAKMDTDGSGRISKAEFNTFIGGALTSTNGHGNGK